MLVAIEISNSGPSIHFGIEVLDYISFNVGWWLLGFSMVLPSYFDIEVLSSRFGPLRYLISLNGWNFVALDVAYYQFTHMALKFLPLLAHIEVDLHFVWMFSPLYILFCTEKANYLALYI